MLWLALGASFFSFSAGGRNDREQGCWDDGHILRRRDIVFLRGSTQLDWTMWSQAHRVEVRSCSSKGGSTAGRNGDDACSRGSTSPVVGWRRCSRVNDRIDVLYISSLPRAAGDV